MIAANYMFNLRWSADLALPFENTRASTMNVLLRIVDGPEKGKEIVFEQPDRFLIGRAEEAHFRLTENDLYTSRLHCLLEICPPNVYLRDLLSTNGTLVNGVSVAEARLGNGDLISLGATVLRVMLIPSPADKCRVAPLDLPAMVLQSEILQAKSILCSECAQAFPANLDDDRDLSYATCSYLCSTCAGANQREVSPVRMGEYRILEEIGRGGMAVVYKAWHEPTRRLVALKKLLPTDAGNQKASQLLQREMAVLQKLVHPNIVRLIDQSTFGNESYFACEYMDGGDLDKLVTEIRRAPLSIEDGCRFICQILTGLEWAHEHGIIHRDIKPANILLRQTDPETLVAKLSDFGLAKSFADAGASFITRRGDAGGTLLYMAPEQILNYRYVKPPSDLYSVGISLYYLLTGRLPFHFPSPLDRIRGELAGKKYKDEIRIVLEDDPIPICDQSCKIPADLASVVDRSIHKQEKDRFRSATEMKESIEHAVSGGIK
jgi:eukaryotic-like serine/threonine-protein kinase